MIKLQWTPPTGVEDIRTHVQAAIDLEFSTLPPYLYAKLTMMPGTNAAALQRLDVVVGQEMVHMCLASNIMNAIGGTVGINPPKYPGPLPGDVDATHTAHLYPFSLAAMEQGKWIEEPNAPIKPSLRAAAVANAPVTIGEFYALLDAALALLPASAWSVGRNQIDDEQFFAGQLFAVNNYSDAHRAIQDIVSEGEGTPVAPEQTGSPLDFHDELAHYYRFWEVARDQVLDKAGTPSGYAWGAKLGVDWSAVYPAIADPGLHDFSKDPPAAQAAQAACNAAYTGLVDALRGAFAGQVGGLGVAVRAMFGLRMAAMQALQSPLADGTSVSGPAFRYLGGKGGAK